MFVRNVDKELSRFIFSTLFLTIIGEERGLFFKYGFCKNYFTKVLTISTPYYPPIFSIFLFKS